MCGQSWHVHIGAAQLSKNMQAAAAVRSSFTRSHDACDRPGRRNEPPLAAYSLRMHVVMYSSITVTGCLPSGNCNNHRMRTWANKTAS